MRQTLENQLIACEADLRISRDQLEKTLNELKAKLSLISSLDDSRLKLEEQQKYLKDLIYEKELEVARERELNLALQDEKYSAINKYDGEL